MSEVARLTDQVSDRTSRAMSKARHPSQVPPPRIDPPPQGELEELIQRMSEVIAEQALCRSRMATLRRRRASLKRALAAHGVNL